VKAANPRALYCCDPVIGDVGRGVFVRPGIPEFMRDAAVPAADIVTPNQFELGFLTNTTPETLESTLASADAAMAMGPSTVLVTSVLRPDRPRCDCRRDVRVRRLRLWQALPRPSTKRRW